MLLYYTMVISNYLMFFTFTILLDYADEISRIATNQPLFEYRSHSDRQSDEYVLHGQSHFFHLCRNIPVLIFFHALFLSSVFVPFAPGLEANCQTNTYRKHTCSNTVW